jgi:hypothetical protein
MILFISSAGKILGYILGGVPETTTALRAEDKKCLAPEEKIS